MSNLIVHGGTPLAGRIVPSANKNAVLPILCATLLTREPVRLHGVPDITDVKKILDVFRSLGSSVEMDAKSRVLNLHHRDTHFDAARDRLPEEMRSSIMLVPGLLARFCSARIEDDVTGCTLGVREIDPHVEVFQRFGASVERQPDGLVLAVPARLQANDHWTDYASVTTTENFVLCRRPGQRPFDADERRLRAPCAGVLRLSEAFGRADRRPGHLAPDHPRRRAPGRR